MGKRRRKHIDIRRFRSVQGGIVICPDCTSDIGSHYHYEDCKIRQQLGERNSRKE